MEDSILALSKELITFRSNPEETKVLSALLDRVLQELSGFTIEYFEDKGVRSALVYNRETRPEVFKILLNAHLDVIPAKEHQYMPYIEGNRLYGAGAMDMKSNAVCLLHAFREVASRVSYPLALQLVTDEEVGGFHGTKHQVDQGVRADFIVAGEPTNLCIAHKAKGVLLATIHASGTTAHGAYPWRGDNALWKLHTYMTKLQEAFPLPNKEIWATTVNWARQDTTNYSFNKIPDQGTVSLDIRYIPDDAATIEERLRAFLPEGCTLEVIANEPAVFVEKTHPHITHLQKLTMDIAGITADTYGAQGTSDARHFARVGGKGIEFGPIGGGIGTDEEWVDIPSLEKYTQIMQQFLLEIDRAF